GSGTGAGAAGATASPDPTAESGCGCRVVARGTPAGMLLSLLALLGLVARRRHRALT
ncbi:MAG: hypothetical protein HY908_03785, partial [Myxococcales bacterium]|nr:hypothetical protein [Myxococcales bacterium]